MKLADHIADQDVTVLHDAVPGRLRLRVRRLKATPALGRRLELGLAGWAGIHAVRAGLATGSLLVAYDPILPAEEVIDRVRGLLAVPAPANDLCTPEGVAGHGEAWHCLPEPELHARLGSRPGGLTTAEAAESLRRHGRNLLPSPPPRSGLAIFAAQFRSLPVGMLAVAAGLSLVTGGLADAAVILSVVMINAGIGAVTEAQAERTIRGLSATAPAPARVLRDGVPCEVDAADVAVGDVLVLVPCGFIPADARVIDARDLTVDEALLTGESLPVSKRATTLDGPAVPVADRLNMVYRGTAVTGGAGLALVVATGAGTEMAGIQALLSATAQPDTPLQRQLDEMGNRLVWSSAAICAGVFGLGLARGYGLIPMVQGAIALAVAALPEGLPTVATTTLALGVREMRRNKVLVRRLSAVEALGSVDVICFDKTGTLTLNRMSVVELATLKRTVTLTEGQFRHEGQPLQPLGDLDLRLLLRAVALCSEAEADRPVIRGSATESALLRAAQQAGIDIAGLRARHPLLELVPRTGERPLMTTLHAAGAARLVAVKGNPDDVLALCGRVLVDGRPVPLDEAQRLVLRERNRSMADEALRVLGVAYDQQPDQEGELEETGLIWLGLAGLADPVRPGMADLMARFRRAGIEVAMVTGDQPATARAIARQLGPMTVYARVSPGEKLTIVQDLQRNGRVVAMTGDGVNDSPALRAADVGVAMGGGGTDVAREAADLVLEDDDLETMMVAVARGRTIYRNIRKAVRYLLTTNMSEIQLVLAATALGLGQPLAPMQLLWINLVTDIFPGLALALEPPAPDVLRRRPRDPAEPVITRRALGRSLGESTALAGGALAAFGWGLARHGGGARATSLAFHSLVTAQLLYAVSCRTERGGWAERRKRPANPWLAWALGGSFLAQGLLSILPGPRRLFGLAPVGWGDLGVAAACGVLPVLGIEATRAAASRSSSGSGSNKAHRGAGRRRR